MATKAQCDRYAAELAQRFEDYVTWALANWPREDFPLLRSDFDASRRELGQLLGPKLGEPEEDEADSAAGDHTPEGKNPKNPHQGQYRDTNPMPWP